MPGQYAAKTQVNTGRSREEIERTLRRYGATGFAYGWETDRAVVGFEADGRRVRFELALPDPSDKRFRLTATGRTRTDQAAQAEYEIAERQIWRAFALVIKAKLVAVEEGLVTFEEEFLAHIVLPTGFTVGETVRDGVAEAYRTGKVPALLPDTHRAIER
jgi:hypothetical protein